VGTLSRLAPRAPAPHAPALAVALAVVLAPGAGLVGCGQSDDPAPAADAPASTCVDDATGRALPAGARCLRLTAARVRSGGAWAPLPLTDVVVRPLADGSVALSAAAPAPAEAFELTIAGATGSAMLQQGYQSWSFSGAARIPASVPLHADGALEGKAASTGDPVHEVLGVSYGAALVGDPGGAAVALGTTSSDVASTAISAVTGADGPIITALHGAAREVLPAVNGKVTMPELVVAARPAANDALASLAAAMKQALPPGARAPRRPPSGWYSWNQLFAAVDEQSFGAHIDIAASKLAPSGLSLVELDDGWEVAWGDWRANPKFPQGMDAVGKAITDKGLIAGIWLAPFLVDIDSPVAAATDPSFFVRGPDGSPLAHKPSGGMKSYYVLDGTNPAAMALVTEPIAKLASAGFTFFKLDFLYAGGLPGGRSDPAATGLQALAAGLASVRTAMGPEATFNACGAPIFPLLGRADSMRIGSDTAFDGVPLAWSAVAFAARSTAARSFLSPLVWLDGDQTQVRAPFTLDEARASAFVAALSGPAYALGDDLRTLPAERLSLALDPVVLDLAAADAPALPDDPLEGPADAVVASPVIDAITHIGSTGAPPPTHWTMRGKSGAIRKLTFRWTDEHGVTVGELGSARRPRRCGAALPTPARAVACLAARSGTGSGRGRRSWGG
jgi:hypothetical protein